MKKLSFFLMAMLMSVMSFAQTAETVTMNLAEGVHDGSQITWTELNGSITITQMQGTSQNAVNANYIAAPRLYKGHILSFECVDNYTITAIKINYNGTYYGNTILVGNTQTDNVVTNNTDLFTGNFATAQNGSHEITTTNVAGESKILIQNSASNSNVQLRPKSIEISYIKAATSEPTITCGDIVFKASDAKNKEVEVIGENLTEAIVATLKTGTNFAVEGTLTTTGGTLTISVTATESGEYSDVLVLTAGEIIKEVNVTATVIKMDGDGTEENPYSVADVIALANPGVKAWVEGYIVGSMNNNKLEETPTNATNIALATTADDTENIIPVQLPSGNVRTALNVVDNPSNLGAKVAIYGTLEAYFSKPGVKNVSDYEILSTVTPEPVMFTVTATAENGTVEGFGEYEEGAEATLTATPAEGYEFVNWTKGEEVVSTENPYTFVVTADVALVANFAVVEPEVIAYELNGGELPTATVPTQDSLIAAFKDGYNAYFGVSVATTRAIDNFLYAGAAVNVPTCDVSLFMKDDASPWKWLGDYVLAVTNAQIEAGTLSTLKELATELMWRQSLTGFFLQQTKLDSNYKGNADFTEAGKPEAWGAAYQAAHAVVLPTEPVDAPYTLPTPVKDGFTFVGWYDNAEGTGEAYTVIPAGWSGTLYAIWKQSPATALENIAVEGKAVKAIINGQLIIIKNGVQYNAQGAVVK